LADEFLAAQYNEDHRRRFIHSFTLRTKPTTGTDDDAASPPAPNSELAVLLVAYKSEKVDETDHFNSYIKENICHFL
jgi:hypothetical protein